LASKVEDWPFHYLMMVLLNCQLEELNDVSVAEESDACGVIALVLEEKLFKVQDELAFLCV
jgi:hypothetical protein